MEMKEILTVKDRRLDAMEQENMEKHKMLEAQRVEIKQLTLKVELQESKLNALQRESRSSGLERIPEGNVTLRQTSTRIPRSCADLRDMGHTSSGIYSILGAQFMESVFCDFCKAPTDPGAQKLIGYVDVKTTPVYFLANRYWKWDWTEKHTPVKFNVVSPNIGGAMNGQTGRFTAPRRGKYFFFAAGVFRFPASSGRLFIELDLFWNNRQFATGAAAVTNPVAGHTETFSLQATLDIEANDDVILMILPQSMSPGIVIEGGTRFQFTGFMLEEEIAQSPNVKQITS